MKLQPDIANCSNGFLRLKTGIWIGVTNDTDGDLGYIVEICPSDYCTKEPVDVSLKSSHEIDRQCAHNRSGVLCGECEQGLSLILATSKCKECSNIYLLLLIPFALAGIVLVTFILAFNITIATGNVHGLIFYANVLAANKAVFLPFDNVLTVITSWVNLDLGIETCFYGGMSSQAKVLLQLVFSAYLFFLMLGIIVLCKYFDSFSKILSNANPVAALCTLFLLSYSKLLRFIISALQFKFLRYPDGSDEMVWLYDANVQYFNPEHIPRFIAAVVILTAGGLFTVLIFFGQWFPYCSKLKLMKWTKNTKYIGFMDAYHAPFTPKHHYWLGLLLFSLIANNIIAAMATDTYLPIMSAGCIAIGICFFKLIFKKVHKASLGDLIETLFLFNLAILAYGTSYVRDIEGNQYILANFSMSIALILFLTIVCFHTPTSTFLERQMYG